jgi:hypothetical protein
MNQTQRARAEDVMCGLGTTSAKIRALAHAGYDRTEISQQLGIRYQHVRQVLIDAGIAGGLRRRVEAERQPVTIDAMPMPREHTSSEVLLRAGFQCLGEWTRDTETEIRLDAKVPTEPGIYAFVIDDVVVYIGLTQISLRTRLDHYRRGHEGQRTNARIKKLIVDALAESQHVKIMVATPALGEWKGLPVNMAAGLEAGLIQMVRPAWNILGANPASVVSANATGKNVAVATVQTNEGTWGQIVRQLHAGETIRNWGHARGYTGGTFQIESIANSSVTVFGGNMTHPRVISKRDFQNVHAVWTDYCAGNYPRSKIADLSQNVTYILSILHHTE